MELQKNRTKEIVTQKQSGACSKEVPAKYSRQKAIQFAKDKGAEPIPEKEARVDLYMMFVKIGATGEVPQEDDLRVSYMNDFWRVMYLENNFCPGDIPFHIIINEFTKAMVQGQVDRKGNNQAAICRAFNKWITRDNVRRKLYQKRDKMYPHKKPKQIEKTATPETLDDYSDEELISKYKAIKPMSGLQMVNMMLKKLKTEIEKRGLSKAI